MVLKALKCQAQDIQDIRHCLLCVVVSEFEQACPPCTARTTLAGLDRRIGDTNMSKTAYASGLDRTPANHVPLSPSDSWIEVPTYTPIAWRLSMAS
jgi:hypothetical protein